MKVVILAGGYGTRLSEETKYIPKPMVEIGEKPILWHIMKQYSECGFNEFIICLGYKQHVIKDYFFNYYLNCSDITFDMKNNNMEVHKSVSENWKITLIDTGLNTMTGGRIKRIKDYIDDDTFMVTYGDAVSDIDIKKVLKYHQKNKKIATLTAINIESRFGTLSIGKNDNIEQFNEKIKNDDGFINGGFMVFNKKIFDYIKDDSTILEKDVLPVLAKENELMAYKYDGFWQCMDTLKEKIYLDDLIKNNKAPWIKW